MVQVRQENKGGRTVCDHQSNPSISFSPLHRLPSLHHQYSRAPLGSFLRASHTSRKRELHSMQLALAGDEPLRVPPPVIA